MFKRFLAAVLLSLTATTAFAAGSEVRTLTTPGRIDKPGMIEVREFFWYGCMHCYKLEPYLAAWLKTKPANVNFVRTPAAMTPQWEVNARGYYAADLMGIVEKSHAALFDAIHLGKRPLNTQDSLAAFYAGYGVSPASFKSNYNSFAVDGKVAQSRSLAKFYELDGVPAVVVNGKYVIKGDGPEVIATLKQLVEQERARKK